MSVTLLWTSRALNEQRTIALVVVHFSDHSVSHLKWHSTFTKNCCSTLCRLRNQPVICASSTISVPKIEKAFTNSVKVATDSSRPRVLVTFSFVRRSCFTITMSAKSRILVTEPSRDLAARTRGRSSNWLL